MSEIKVSDYILVDQCLDLKLLHLPNSPFRSSIVSPTVMAPTPIPEEKVKVEGVKAKDVPSGWAIAGKVLPGRHLSDNRHSTQSTRPLALLAVSAPSPS